MNTIIIAAAGVPLSNVIGARPAVKPFLVTGVILLIIGIIGIVRSIMLSGQGRRRPRASDEHQSTPVYAWDRAAQKASGQSAGSAPIDNTPAQPAPTTGPVGISRRLEVVCAVLMNIGGGVGIFLLIIALGNGTIARPDISTRSLEHEYGISIVKVAGAGYADTISAEPSHDTGTAIVFKRGGEQVNGVIVVDDNRVTVFAMTGSHGDLKELKPVTDR
jgi:hypothetical protein